MRLNPERADFHSNLVYALYFSPDYDAQTIYQEHCLWNELHAKPFAKCIAQHDNDRTPDRRLRVGYLSPDFRGHPVGRFLLPLLQEHDHDQFDVFCYSSVRRPDELTERCRPCADQWRDVLKVADEELAKTIRADRIDILIDLTMHMADNRLFVFARKPAPVQVTYLGYCGTTGLETIDYRLTDSYLDPPGLDEKIYSEESIWLPDTYWCYLPTLDGLEVASLPALKNRHITFGCLNNFCKVTKPTLDTWSRLLRALPDARLHLHAKGGGHRERVLGYFAEQGVRPERITFIDKMRLVDYFRVHDQIDIALDPFPYGGGTTTCDALWMGVPVVSLVGETAVGRAGLSILSNLGLPELAAKSADEYVRIAAELAADHVRLSELRSSLRERMKASPLMNAPRFARAVEAAYRNMWQRWCG